MLSEKYLNAVSNAMLDIYGELEMEILIEMTNAIERSLKAASFNSARRKEATDIFRKVLLLSSSIENKSNVTLNKTFADAIKKSYNFESGIYKKANIEVGDLASRPYLLKIFDAGLLRTQGSLSNLSATMAITSRDKFLELTDLAHIEIATGVTDYNTAIKKVVGDMAKSGVTTINYVTGAKIGLDSAVRRAVLTGVNQTALSITDELGDELGQDLVETSSHYGAREGEGVANHLGWQGKIFSKSGENKKYPHFKTVTGYGSGPGLGGWNCRHSFYPFIEGVSEPNPRLKPKPDVKYNGKIYTFYEATQRQRAIERNIKRWKREEKLLKVANQDYAKATDKIKQWQREARLFTKETGILRRYDLESIKY